MTTKKSKKTTGVDPAVLKDIQGTLSEMQGTIEGQASRITELTEEGKRRETELLRLRQTGGLAPPKASEQPQLEKAAIIEYLEAPPQEGVFYTVTPYYFQLLYDGDPVWNPDERRHVAKEMFWIEAKMWPGAGIDVKHPESGKLLFPRGVGFWDLNTQPLILEGIYDREEALARIRGDADYKVHHTIMEEDYYKELISTYYEATWTSRAIHARFKGSEEDIRSADLWKGGAKVRDGEDKELPAPPTVNTLPPGTQDPTLVGAPSA